MAVVLNNHVEIIEGEARVVGTTFRVADVAAIYVLGASPIEWIVENYPLTPAQVHATLAYYYDHQDEIERVWRETDTLARSLGTSAADLIARMQARRDPPASE